MRSKVACISPSSITEAAHTTVSCLHQGQLEEMQVSQHQEHRHRGKRDRVVPKRLISS